MLMPSVEGGAEGIARSRDWYGDRKRFEENQVQQDPACILPRLEETRAFLQVIGAAGRKTASYAYCK